MSGGSPALCQGNFTAFHFDIITSVRGVFVALCTLKVCSFSGLKAERAAQRGFLDFLLLLFFFVVAVVVVVVVVVVLLRLERK